MSRDLEGRTVLVTGASEGIGWALTRALASRGARVLAVARAGGRGPGRVAELLRGEPGSDVRFLPADLLSLSDVRRLAARVRSEAPVLHALAHNAGAFFPRRRTTEDGLEATEAVHHVAAAVLTVLLAPSLAAAAPGTVVYTSSGAARWGCALRPTLPAPVGYHAFAAYAHAKLAGVASARALARLLSDDTLVVCAFDPGIVQTGFGDGPGALQRAIRWAMRWRGRSPEHGAATGVWLLAGGAGARAHGRFYKDGRAVPIPWQIRRPAVALAVWERALRLGGVTEQERAAFRALQRG